MLFVAYSCAAFSFFPDGSLPSRTREERGLMQHHRPQSHIHTGRESHARAAATPRTQWIEALVSPREHDGKRVRRASVLRWLRNNAPDVEPRNPRVTTSRLGDRLEAWAKQRGFTEDVHVDVESMDRFLTVVVRTTPEVRCELERDPDLQDLHITDWNVTD